MSQSAKKRSRSHEFDTMNQLAKKRPRSQLTASDYEGSRSCRAKKTVYESSSYPVLLGYNNCHMEVSSEGPMPEDIALCRRLLHQPVTVPDDTMLDDKYINQFLEVLANGSEAHLLVLLHPLLVPAAEFQYFRGRLWLKDVTDKYNELWSRADPICGPRPQPNHARGLKHTTFSIAQRQKLGITSTRSSLNATRRGMCFPYLTTEVERAHGALEIADRRNMHSMSIAIRAVASLAQKAGCPETVHRRILGFSTSHSYNYARIYGYYPQIVGDKISVYRWSIIENIDISLAEGRWACYRFVENLDREFLPIHINRLMQFLEKIPDPEDSEFLAPQIPSQIRPSDNASEDQLVQLQKMVQGLTQQVKEQSVQEEKMDAERKKDRERYDALEERYYKLLDSKVYHRTYHTTMYRLENCRLENCRQ